MFGLSLWSLNFFAALTTLLLDLCIALGIKTEVVEMGSESDWDLLTSFATSDMTMFVTWSKTDPELGEEESSHLSLMLGR